MEIIYRAEDGKEFDDKYKCEDYERSLCIHTFKMWDNKYKPLTDYNSNAYAKAVYVMVKNFDEINDMKEEFDYYGFSHNGIYIPGFYCFRFNSHVIGSWEIAKNIIRDYQKEINNIEKMMKSVDELNERDIL